MLFLSRRLRRRDGRAGVSARDLRPYDVGGGNLGQAQPRMTFIYVSGAGTDSTERGRMMWARVKGKTENALLQMPFKAAYMFRPGYIQPLHGVRTKTQWYRVFYAVMGPLYPLWKALAAEVRDHDGVRGPRDAQGGQARRSETRAGEHGYQQPLRGPAVSLLMRATPPTTRARQKRHPILQRLQGKAAKDESNAEGAQPALRQVVRVVLDIRSDRLSHAGDHAGHEPDSNCERPVHVMNQSAADQRRGEIAKGADDRSPKLTTGQARTARRHVIHARSYAARIADNLANGDDNGKHNGEFKTDNPVESDSNANRTDRGAKGFPRKGIMLQPPSHSIEFDRKSDTGGNAGNKAKEGTETEAIADAEYDGVRYSPRKQSQRAMLSTEEVISKIKTPQHAETTARNADGRDCMVIHSGMERLRRVAFSHGVGLYLQNGKGPEPCGSGPDHFKVYRFPRRAASDQTEFRGLLRFRVTGSVLRRRAFA